MHILLCHTHEVIEPSSPYPHPCWELVYRVSGTTTTVIEEKSYRITGGDFYLVPPNVTHFDLKGETFVDLFIHFDSLDFLDVVVSHDYDGYLKMLAQMMHQVLLEQEYNYRNIVDSIGETISQYIKKYVGTAYQSPVVYRLKNIIYTNIGNAQFDLMQEIQNTGFHPNYVRRCFKKETGKTPLSYLTELRLNKAKQMLVMHTYEGIENVAAACGFQDSFYFSTCFKKHTGMPPSQYRKQFMA